MEFSQSLCSLSLCAVLMAAMDDYADVHSDPEPPMLPGEQRQIFNAALVEVESWKSLRPGRIAWNRTKVESRQLTIHFQINLVLDSCHKLW